MDNILIELILTNQCNQRCQYCDLNFKDKSLSYDELDLFINFLKNNKANYAINFFGGEPLLAFDKLRHLVDNSKLYVNKYSVGTNGVLLDSVKLSYFKKNNVDIHLSIDNINKGNNLDLLLLSDYKDIIKINFVNDPEYLGNSIGVFDKIKMYGFGNISFMPVYSTKKWSPKNLLQLQEVYNYMKSHSADISLHFFKYFNGVSIDRQFILDTDLYFYSDIDSLLWLQKQYKVIGSILKKEINKKTKLFSLLEKNINLENLLKSYDINNILKLIFFIPKHQGLLSEYKIIDNILN